MEKDISSFADWPGSQEEWTDSLQRACVYRRFVLKEPRALNEAMAFINLPQPVSLSTLVVYAKSIGLSC